MGLLYAGLNRSPLGPQLRLRVLAGLCGVMMLVSGSLRGEAGAAEWSADPSLSVKGLYNSNLLLFNGNNEVWGQWVSPGLKFKGSTESLEVEGNVKSDFVQYYGEHGSKPDQSVFSVAGVVPAGSIYVWVRGRLYARQYLAKRIAADWIGLGFYSTKPVECHAHYLQLESRNGCPGKAAISSRMRSMKMGFDSVS